MICFRDMTFCSAKCANLDCERQFGSAEQKAAEKWWGNSKPPVALLDFSKTCPVYEPLK